MEENQPNPVKYALNFGILLGVVGIVFALMLYSLDMHYQGGFSVMGISIALTLAAVVIGMLQFKKANNGFMSMGQAMKIGVGICLIGGIIGILFNQVMVNFIDPEMMSKAMELQKEQLLENTKMTPDQVDAQMEMGKKFSTPSMQIVFGLLYVVVSGFIFSLIPALILKKNENVN